MSFYDVLLSDDTVVFICVPFCSLFIPVFPSVLIPHLPPPPHLSPPASRTQSLMGLPPHPPTRSSQLQYLQQEKKC